MLRPFVPYLSEFLGTFLLMLSMAMSGGNAFIVGATYCAIILLTGQLSGANVNPAISIVMALKGALSMVEFAGYATAQIAGAVVSYYMYVLLR